MKKVTAILVASALHSAAVFAASVGDEALPPPVLSAVKAVLERADAQPPEAGNPGRTVQALAELNHLVDERTTNWARSREGWDLNAKFIRLACECTAHPERLAEIYEYYFREGLKHYIEETERREPQLRLPGATLKAEDRVRPHVCLGPPLRPEHVNEAYRAAWECLAMIQGFDSSVDRNADRLLEALSAIGNADSAIVLGHRCASAANTFRALPRDELQALSRMPGRQGLSVLLDVLRQCRGRRRAHAAEPSGAAGIPGLLSSGAFRSGQEDEWSWNMLLDAACEAFRDQAEEKADVAAKWLEALSSRRAEPLSVEDEQVLERLAGALSPCTPRELPLLR